MIYESGRRYSQILQYTTARPFSKLQSINLYAFCILSAYLSSEAINLKMSIIFVAGTMEAHTHFIVLKMRTRLWARDTHLLADGIVDIQTS